MYFLNRHFFTKTFADDCDDSLAFFHFLFPTPAPCPWPCTKGLLCHDYLGILQIFSEIGLQNFLCIFQNSIMEKSGKHNFDEANDELITGFFKHSILEIGNELAWYLQKLLKFSPFSFFSPLFRQGFHSHITVGKEQKNSAFNQPVLTSFNQL